MMSSKNSDWRMFFHIYHIVGINHYPALFPSFKFDHQGSQTGNHSRKQGINGQPDKQQATGRRLCSQPVQVKMPAELRQQREYKQDQYCQNMAHQRSCSPDLAEYRELENIKNSYGQQLVQGEIVRPQHQKGYGGAG